MMTTRSTIPKSWADHRHPSIEQEDVCVHHAGAESWLLMIDGKSRGGICIKVLQWLKESQGILLEAIHKLMMQSAHVGRSYNETRHIFWMSFISPKMWFFLFFFCPRDRTRGPKPATERCIVMFPCINLIPLWYIRPSLFNFLFLTSPPIHLARTHKPKQIDRETIHKDMHDRLDKQIACYLFVPLHD